MIIRQFRWHRPDAFRIELNVHAKCDTNLSKINYKYSLGCYKMHVTRLAMCVFLCDGFYCFWRFRCLFRHIFSTKDRTLSPFVVFNRYCSCFVVAIIFHSTNITHFHVLFHRNNGLTLELMLNRSAAQPHGVSVLEVSRNTFALTMF